MDWWICDPRHRTTTQVSECVCSSNFMRASLLKTILAAENTFHREEAELSDCDRRQLNPVISIPLSLPPAPAGTRPHSHSQHWLLSSVLQFQGFCHWNERQEKSCSALMNADVTTGPLTGLFSPAHHLHTLLWLDGHFPKSFIKFTVCHLTQEEELQQSQLLAHIHVHIHTNADTTHEINRKTTSKYNKCWIQSQIQASKVQVLRASLQLTAVQTAEPSFRKLRSETSR